MGAVKVPGGGGILMARTKCTEITNYTRDEDLVHIPLDIAAWAAKAEDKSSYYATLVFISKQKKPYMDTDGEYRFKVSLLKFRKKYGDVVICGIRGTVRSGASDYNFTFDSGNADSDSNVIPEIGGIAVNCALIDTDVVWVAIMENGEE